MTTAEVEAIMGRPLRIVPWDQMGGSPNVSMWFYTDQPSATANYHRRWVQFEGDKVIAVINDFWID
jgi:hypothetical protein